MMSLDSIYAMLARPALPMMKQKRIVKQINNTAQIAADSHEAPQSQLPPHLERRKTPSDRRKNSPRDGQMDPALDRRQSVNDDRRTENKPRESDSDESTHSHIDINV